MKKPVFHILFILLIGAPFMSIAQEHEQEEGTHQEQVDTEKAPQHGDSDFHPGETALHHIADANAFHIFGDVYLHLPCIFYSVNQGWTFLSTSAQFEPEHHGTGALAIDRYVLKDGAVKHIVSEDFPMGEQEIDGFTTVTKTVDDETVNKDAVKMNGETYLLESKSALDGGLMGGGLTGFYDFSITKNVFTLLLVGVLLFLMFIYIARRYKQREGKPPKGIQSFIEPIFVFIQDEVAKPFLRDDYMRFLPLLQALFFFILGLNLIGQIPFFPGSANVTGNLAVTGALALFTFLVTNLNGNRDYWRHIFWMPGVPWPVKIILTPAEILGVFVKPITLMLRLFANITAGHIVIICFIGLIFVFGNVGQSLPGTTMGIILAVPVTAFMMAIELLVAFIQAFVFVILTASYIGAAIEEHH